MGSFYRKECGAKDYKQKKRKNYFRQNHLPMVGRPKDFTMQVTSSSVGEGRRPVSADDLIGAYQKIPD